MMRRAFRTQRLRQAETLHIPRRWSSVAQVSTVSVAPSFRTWNNKEYTSPYDAAKCPLDVVVLYNPSNHANNVAVQDLLRAWPNLIIVQTVQAGRLPVVGVSDHLAIPKGTFGNMDVFVDCYREFLVKNRTFRQLNIGFYPIWSSMAEDAELAKAVQKAGLHWVGASPSSMEGLGKIEYKIFCEQHKLPTAEFFVLSPDEPISRDFAAAHMADTYRQKVKGTGLEGRDFFVKSVHGGGGRGTCKASPDGESVITAIRRVITETGRTDGIYAELALDLKGASLYQLEMEVDAGKVVDGGRLVYFNNRNQKMVELGFSERELVRFLPPHVYEGCCHATAVIAEGSKYDGRGTNEILIAKLPSGEWKFYCSEFNKRIQVEHKALSYLKRYKTGHPFNTVADQVMRSCGFRPPDYRLDLDSTGANAVAHVRLIAPDITPDGHISFPTGVDVEDVILPAGFTATAHPGKLYADTDAQFGCSLITGADWEKLLAALQLYCRETVIQGTNVSRDYFSFLQKFFNHPKVHDLSLGCNRTFDVLSLPNMRESRIFAVNQYLKNSVARVIVNGYRRNAGVPNRSYPTDDQIQRFTELRDKLLTMKVVKNTPFLAYLDHLDEDRYYGELRDHISKRGGAMVSVFPRDVQQEIAGSESQLITFACRLLLERVGADAGFIGYEMGGAQYQTAEMNLISSSAVLHAGLLCNCPTFSLTRSHWMNGLEKLNPDEVRFVLSATADVIRSRFHLPHTTKVLPYFPYNFHAGNVSEQDEVSGLMLDAGFTPIPNWVWDPRFDQAELETWVQRQIDLFHGKTRGGTSRKLHHLRIKNAGQQKEWTVDNVWRSIETMRKVYKRTYGPKSEPIIQIHNHNFNGLASHVGAGLFEKAQAEGYRLLVIDSAPPAMTHNNNLVLAKKLQLSRQERENLYEFNEAAHVIWGITERFRDYPLLRIDPETIWAGGTGSSDITAAEKNNIARSDIEDAKFLGAKVSGLAGIVTPYSQWSMVIGYTCYKQGLRTFEDVLAHIKAGGLLKLPPNILRGLDEWRTLLPRPPHVTQLLANHKNTEPGVFAEGVRTAAGVDLDAAREAIREAAPYLQATDDRLARQIAYGNFATACIKAEATGNDLAWLLRYPEIGYASSVPPGKQFSILGVPVTFVGIEEAPFSSNVVVTFRAEGQWVRAKTTDVAKAMKLSTIVENTLPVADSKNPNHVGAFMPGIVESVNVKIGQKIKTGDVLYGINSMKMVTTFKATEAHNGKTVLHIHVSKGTEVGFKPMDPAPLIITLTDT